jgi:hypothetical protein
MKLAEATDLILTLILAGQHPFATGDRVDVMFENHLPDRTVIEVEIEGEREVCVGIHQVIKYRSLAAADAIRMSRSSPDETFRYSRRVPVALETASATSSMVNGGPPSSYTASRGLSWVSALTQAAA